MALDGRYFVSIDLEEYLVDNTTGAPLTNGTIEFWKDDDRTTPKTVYELSGAPPNYTYTALPNPLNISAVGTPVDNSGNNINIYYFPYDADGNIELYYIVVKDSDGNVQFTRQAWPNVTGSTNPAEADSDISNELSNPQFVEVNFALSNPMVITISGAGTTTSIIAPDWDLVTTSTGASTVTVQRNAIAGTSQYPSNPPYTLSITPGANISGIYLRQRLLNNPDVFAPKTNGTNGYVSASVLLAPSNSVTIQYQPNGQVAQTILSANNTTGLYTQYNATVQLSAANNSNNGDTGYVDILVNLAVTGTTTLSNLQIVGLNSDVQNVAFDQTTANRQRDQLFNYYGPLLQYKPIPSYLVGWDFPLNPAQPLGDTVAASAIGANKSKYVWDQTILFQSANSGAGITRSASGNGAMRVTAAATTQFALIQYLPQAVARRVLQENLSVNVAAITDKASGLLGTVSLWYTTDVSLPSTIGSNNSLVLSLDANGKPATFNGSWTEVPRSGLGDAQFTATNTDGLLFNDYGLSGWSLEGAAAVDTATFFAIVVGFASMAVSDKIDIGSISLVPGSIPTRPAPQSPNQVLSDCQYYFEMSFNIGFVPAQNFNFSHGAFIGPYVVPTFAGISTYAWVPFSIEKNNTPTTITLYNPSAANAEMATYAVNVYNADMTGSTIQSKSKVGFAAAATTGPAGNTAGTLAFGWTADARLGQ